MSTVKKKINIIDLIMVVAALLIISFFVSFYFADEPLFDVSQKEIVEVEAFVRIPSDIGYPITVGQNISADDFDSIFGNVKNIRYSSPSGAEDGTQLDGMLDAIIVIECSASADEDFYRVGDVAFNEGDLLTLSTRDFCFSADVTGVRRRIAFADESNENDIEVY